MSQSPTKIWEASVTMAPHPGDVVIHREVHSPAVYVLSVFSELRKITCKTYDDAFDRAQRFALREHLDAWYTTDEHVFERVAQYRPTRS